MFYPEIVMTLHSQRTSSFRVLKRNAFVTYELDIPWDPDISPILSGEDSIHSVLYAFSLLSLPIAVCLKSHFYLYHHGSDLRPREHSSKLRSRPPTRRALGRISRGVSDRSRAMRARRYIESSNFFEKTRQILKNIDINIHVSYVQNISPSTLNIKRKHKYTRYR